MQALEGLRKSINTAEELQSVVKSMKGMAAANIRHLAAAVESLAEYSRSVELALQVLFSERPQYLAASDAEGSDGRLGMIVFGSDQGMCGRFNLQVTDRVVETLTAHDAAPQQRSLLAVGGRIIPLLESADLAIDETIAPATSLSGIGDFVRELLVRVQAWRSGNGSESPVSRVLLCYNRSLGGASYEPHVERLVPLDFARLREQAAADWPGRGLPTITLPWADLLASVVREHLHIGLFRAAAESLASENASRLASMQAAERNIDDRLGDLGTKYRMQRQQAITEELLDIAAGFEALGKDE